ncbi:filamentous hemagglutinin N-terminal domain-containing protein [Leptolyngbya sp. AN03gr2]|uniref:two-partner secretion domain-containing protein n=1 Tax=unclassified Leptolyngbya TaxID=2650499 RepID=UPI003D3245C4
MHPRLSLSVPLALLVIQSTLAVANATTISPELNVSSASVKIAQIIPDQTLPVNSQVEAGCQQCVIEGGTVRGSNLFHSFNQFSIPTGGEAFFNQSPQIQTIFARVTGGLNSTIDGTIRVNGASNLVLINPRGIIFGSNARLNIGGSFLGSTASTIRFQDGTEFNAIAPQEKPLLTISAPIGLGFLGNTSSIQVQGAGHDVQGIRPPVTLFPITQAATPIGLQVRPGRTLALIGGEVRLNGGIVKAPSGRVEIAGVQSGEVRFQLFSNGWTFNYGKVAQFQDVRLAGRSLIDASGLGGGEIALQGKQIRLQDGSIGLIQNFGIAPSGAISINATGSVEISGTDPIARIPGGFYTEALRSGAGADIVITTPNLTLTTGGALNTRTYSSVDAGKITIQGANLVQLIGTSPIDLRAASAIYSTTFSDGRAGDIEITTRQYQAIDGGVILSSSRGRGAGGNIIINTSESIRLVGVAALFQPSVISAGTFDQGNAGEVTLNTQNLIVQNGGRVDSSTAAQGSAGSVRINAIDSVEVSGTVPNSRNPSLIISAANILDPVLRQTFFVPPALTGESGDVTIQTRELKVSNGAQVTVKNEGSGNAGTLRVNARSIDLDQRGQLAASTQSGQGGNIVIQSDQVKLQRGSSITATAGGRGDGGNVTINTDILAILRNSSIIANAERGSGGSIAIRAQGVFSSSDSLISATSAVDPQLNGTVQIDAPQTTVGDVAPSSVELLTIPPLRSTCPDFNEAGTNRFTISGAGGLPSTPAESLELDQGWQGNRVQPSNGNLPSQKPEIVEAQGWERLPDGTVRLVAYSQSPAPTNAAMADCFHHRNATTNFRSAGNSTKNKGGDRLKY